MNKEEVEAMLKHVLRYLDLGLLSYIGYPPDEDVPNPDEFIEGYGKCIEDFIHETQRLGFNLRLQCDQEAGES
jgi:hypothetical protein